jgi:hypothetical protein
MIYLTLLVGAMREGRDMSFKEKSIFGTLLLVLWVAAAYFTKVVAMLTAGDVDFVALGKLAVGLIVFFIVVEIVLHAVIAAGSSKEVPEIEDERDRLIELKGERVGGLLLGIGVAFTIGHIAVHGVFGDRTSSYPEIARFFDNSPFVTANLLLFWLTVSEVGKYVSQLLYYRRGV